MRIFVIILALILFTTTTLSQCLNSEQEFRDYFQKNISTIDPIEGIWSSNSMVKIYQNNQLLDSKYTPQALRVAFINDGENFRSCILSKGDDGSVIQFSKTATPGIYLYQRIFGTSKAIAKSNATLITNGLIEYSYEVPEEELMSLLKKQYKKGMSITFEIKMIKLFPTLDYKEGTSTSGTGFALSTDGLIITNQHVVNGAKNIVIRGINGEFSKSYRSRVILEDKNNDLAILKIDDTAFLSFGKIPYSISKKSCEVGYSIYCLGFPLRATMGDEVKLTNGIISSKSGFQGDLTTYQITAPIQPGNSGGPLFDDKGNVVGVINAKHLGAENVSYAVKISYLLNLIDLLPSPPKMDDTSFLGGKSLADQVKLIKPFVFIVESN